MVNSKPTLLLLVALLLLVSASARPLPLAGSSEVVADGGNKGVEGCEGGGKKEDCLMRRTLEAHLDYIYTQKKKD